MTLEVNMWTKIKMLKTKWKVLILVIIGVTIWITISDANKRKEQAYCENIANKAESAFSDGNFFDAERYYRELVYHDPTCSNRPLTSDRYPLGNERLGELQEYNRAASEKESGQYWSALQTLRLHRPSGELSEEVVSLLNEVYTLLSEDTGQDGMRLLLDMYEVTCGIRVNDLPPLDSLIKSETEIRFWYPGANAVASKSIARTPAEFRIALCYKRIETSIVETCAYTQSGSVIGPGLASMTVRKNATYEVEFKDILIGKTIATSTISSYSPAACPQTMPINTFDNEIIGEPDFSTAILWAEENIQSLK